MVNENVVFVVKAETGQSAEVQGRFTTYPQGMRIVSALIWLGIGFGGALAFIVVPVLHLLTTWALPLAGLMGAWNSLRTVSRVSHLTGRCPVCQGKLLLAGGRAIFPVRDQCEHCSRPLLIHEHPG